MKTARSLTAFVLVALSVLAARADLFTGRDPQVKSDVRFLYDAIYKPAVSAHVSFSMVTAPDPVTGNGGAISPAYRQAVYDHINLVRFLTNRSRFVAVSEDGAELAAVQAAAYLMSRNNDLSHNPDASWIGYNALAAHGAGESQLALGGSATWVDNFLGDHGAENTIVGHRYAILGSNSFSAMGRVSGIPAACALYFDSNELRGRNDDPLTCPQIWPYAGYFPRQWLPPDSLISTEGFRVSVGFLHQAKPSFASATVVVKRNGSVISAPVVEQDTSAGTRWNRMVLSIPVAALADTGTDVTFTVEVSGVSFAKPMLWGQAGDVEPPAGTYGTPRNFSWSFTLFNAESAIPTITTQPASQSVYAGTALLLSVTASGPSLSYQWRKGGASIAGATSSTLTVASAAATDAGTYDCVVTNTSGSVGSSVATVTVVTGGFSQMTGISTRAMVADGSNALIPGISIQGTVPKKILVRAAGPNLLQYGLTNAISDPKIEIIPLGSNTPVATNDNWNSGDTELVAVTSVLGLGSFTVGSKDAALVATLAPGIYTAVCSGVGSSTGVGLVEVYDAEPAKGKMAALSVRAQVGNGNDVLIPGVSVTGSSAKKLLIRALGPKLAEYGVTGVLADPQVQVLPLGSNTPLAGNDNWNSSDTELIAKTNTAGLNGLTIGSKDAALLVTLPPGLYTAVVSGVGNTTGVALVEVYEVD